MAVAYYDYKEGAALDDWAVNKGMEGVKEYRLRKNTHSIDGLEGLVSGG